MSKVQNDRLKHNRPIGNRYKNINIIIVLMCPR